MSDICAPKFHMKWLLAPHFALVLYVSACTASAALVVLMLVGYSAASEVSLSDLSNLTMLHRLCLE